MSWLGSTLAACISMRFISNGIFSLLFTWRLDPVLAEQTEKKMRNANEAGTNMQEQQGKTR